MNDTNTPEKFAAWALVELMGHQRVAGYVTEQTIAGCGMLRVDVPDAKGDSYAFTRFYSPSAVYAITPIDKTLCVGLASNLAARPVTIYDVSKFAADKRISEGEEGC